MNEPDGQESCSEAGPRKSLERRRELPYLLLQAGRNRRVDQSGLQQALMPDDTGLVLDGVGRAVRVAGGEWRSLRSEALLLRILQTLISRGGKPCSKRILFERAWGQTYSRGSHDSALHFNLARLRRALGETGRQARLIRRERAGYSIQSEGGVSWIRPAYDGPERREASGGGIGSAGLMDWIHERGTISNLDYRHRFAVSRATAGRALEALREQGLVTRIGSGRGCYYRAVLEALPVSDRTKIACNS